MLRFASPLLLAALLATAPAAQAAVFVLNPTPAPDGSFSVTFSHENFAGGGFANPNEFEDIFEIALPLAGKLRASITTTSVSVLNNVDFTSVTLNDVNFTLSNDGATEDGDVGPLQLGPGVQRLVVHGFSGGNGSFAGTLSFVADQVAPGVPEPASWALMIMGFGGAGVAVRTRRRRSAA